MRAKDVKAKVNAECTNVTKTRQFNHQKPLLKIAKKERKKKQKPTILYTHSPPIS
jgi:hypothetical protein